MKWDSTYLLPYLIANIVGLLFLWAAVKKQPLARLLFVLLFGWACWINYTLSHEKPDREFSISNPKPQHSIRPEHLCKCM